MDSVYCVYTYICLYICNNNWIRGPGFDRGTGRIGGRGRTGNDANTVFMHNTLKKVKNKVKWNLNKNGHTSLVAMVLGRSQSEIRKLSHNTPNPTLSFLTCNQSNLRETTEKTWPCSWILRQSFMYNYYRRQKHSDVLFKSGRGKSGCISNSLI